MSNCNCGRCATTGQVQSGCIQFEPYVENWLEETGGIIKLVDKTGKETGQCSTAIYPLVRALEKLLPAATTIDEYVDGLNRLILLGNSGWFAEMLTGTTGAAKDALRTALAACSISHDAGNGTVISADGGLASAVVPAAPIAVQIAALLTASLPARQTMAAGLLSTDAANTATLGSDGLIFENDAV